MHQATVAVLFGGRSSEHAISSVTAGGVLGAIDRDRYRVIPVGITREGVFVLESDDPDRYRLDADELPEIVDNGTRILWPMPGGTRELRVRHADGATQSLGEIDVVLPLLHGLYGEDGTIQGFLETLEIPYAGGGILGSALCLDKHFTKIALQDEGLAVAPGMTVRRQRWVDSAAEIRAQAAELGFPMFVKPARAGSSVGVSKVHGPHELDEAMRIAFVEDDKALIEQAMSGREIEVAVLEGRGTERARASLPGEIVVTSREFYDFEGKYLGGDGAEVVCPAELSAEQTARVREIGVRAFEAVDGRGLARVDVFLTDDGDIVVNELNTLPGFTPISMYPKCWIATGLSYADLISELIELGRTSAEVR